MMVTIFLVLLLLVYLVASFFITYHLVKFGSGVETSVLAVVFSLGVVILIIIFLLQFNNLEIPSFSGDFNFFE